MAINVSFNGATIFKPGAYSKVDIDLGGGFPLGPTGLIALFGEADAGAPGSAETDIKNNVFTAEQIPAIRAKYRSGPLVDAASFLFAPGNDGAIPGGAQAVYIYKTNSSTRASLTLGSAYGTVRALEWGIGGNLVTYRNILMSEAPAEVASSAAFDETNISASDQLKLQVNGGAENVFTFPGAPANNANLAAMLADAANWSAGLPAGVTIAVGGVDGASTVSISQDALATAHQLGWGRSFEIREVTGTPLADMNLADGLKVSSLESSATLRLNNTRDLVQEEDILGGSVVLTIGNNDVGGTAATVSIDANSVTLTSVGGANAGTLVAPKASYPALIDLVNWINIQPGWSASVTSALYNQLSTQSLDVVASVGALSLAGERPARLKKDASDVKNFFDLSGMARLVGGSLTGLPEAAAEVALTGGAKGATLTSDIITALDKFTKIRVNSVVPLFSRDAAADIADGLTDAGSTYTILGVHQAVKTHLSLMATTKSRSERQGYLSIKASYEDSKEQSGLLASERIQLMIQDVRQVDAQGNIRWFQPWALAAVMAGARAGASVGTPMTNKFLNLTGIRHTAQPMSTPEEDIAIDFDPDLQHDDAIQSGITFLEAPQTGGFKVVVDNTTYGRDANWVKNRGNVMYAADVLAFDFRSQMEAIFVGQKNTLQAAEIRSVAEAILGTYLSQGITVSTADAPGGFKGLVVELDGNIIRVTVVVKLVEGVDFVLAEITLQRAQSQA
jgi:hypothetical protein